MMKGNCISMEKRMDFKCLSASGLKLIAVITMTIDHIGAVLLPQYLFLRMIGRLAFPIYCYMIVNGLFHTKNCGKYILRLFTFALISEVFFDLAFYGEVINKEHQNVFFTLGIGLTVIAVIEKLRIKYGIYSIFVSTADIIILAAGCATAYFLRTDYSFYGVLMIYGFYSFRFNAVVSSVFQIFINCIILRGVQGFAVFSLIPIWLYNGEKGKNAGWVKWLFYVYYPIHLLVIFVFKKILFY